MSGHCTIYMYVCESSYCRGHFRTILWVLVVSYRTEGRGEMGVGGRRREIEGSEWISKKEGRREKGRREGEG